MVRPVVIGTAVSLIFASAAASQSGNGKLVVRGDTVIAGFRVKADGTLGGAIDALGKPSTIRLRSGVCRVTWRSVAAQMDFYNLGGQDPCSERYGRFSVAVLTGRRWQTSNGLEMNAPATGIRRLHPKARYHQNDRIHGSAWWLVTRYSTIGTAHYYPGLLARVHRGKVDALVVRYPAGGD